MGLSLTVSGLDLLSQVSAALPEVPQSVILEAWRAHAREALQGEIANVTRRTEERAMTSDRATGALASSVTGQTFPTGDTLFDVYFSSGPQYSQWGRYYAPYQEGPPTPGGKLTFTNEPRHMLYDSRTEDAAELQSWATEVGQQAADDWAAQFTGGA